MIAWSRQTCENCIKVNRRNPKLVPCVKLRHPAGDNILLVSQKLVVCVLPVYRLLGGSQTSRERLARDRRVHCPQPRMSDARVADPQIARRASTSRPPGHWGFR